MSAWVWAGTLVVLTAILLVDLFIIGRRPHEPSIRESTLWVAFYVGLALIFGAGLWLTAGATPAVEFYTGWLTEYSLSVDNLFVFVIIMTRFAVPRAYQQKVLLVGHRAGPADARRVHRRRRGADLPVLLGLLHLRRVPDLHRDQLLPAG